MSRFPFIAIGLAAIGAASARDWGFSKDTVHQRWPTDTVYVVNQRADTLRLDSAFLEILQAPGMRMGVWMSWYPYRYGPSLPVTSASTGLSSDRGFGFTYDGGFGLVAPGDSARLSNFNPQECLCIAKRAADATLGKRSAVGDTLRARVRFRSTTGEEDTLIVVGVEDPGVGLSAPMGIRGPGGGGVPGRDLRGRVVMPEFRRPSLKALIRR